MVCPRLPARCRPGRRADTNWGARVHGVRSLQVLLDGNFLHATLEAK